MRYKIIIEPEAQLDIEKAYLYYKDFVNLKTAKLFLKQCKISFKALQMNPFYRIKIKDYRALPLHKFPFLIFFQVIDQLKTVKIIAVFNTQQHPIKYPN